MANKIQLRRDTAANWTSTNPVLAQGEVGYDLTSGKMKVGNGTSTWTQLAYFNDGSFSGSYNDLTDTPTIPADVSDLTDTQNLLGGDVLLETQNANGVTTGAATSISVTSAPNTNWTSTTGITSGDIVLNVDVAVDGTATITVVSGGTGHAVGETATIAGTALGGATPSDDLAFTVDSVTVTAVALALDKPVLKLKDGRYTLANGQEGQVIRLVLQDNTTNSEQIRVTFANARVGGTKYQDIFMEPFASGQPGLVTLLFTDGAWQSDAGLWD